jgi:hypothetical protein
MHSAKRWALVAAATVLGCGGPPAALPAQPGAVRLTWTVDDAATPEACGVVGAGTVRVALSDWEGHAVGEWTAACADFAATLSGLAPDEYTGRVELLDDGGQSCVPPVSLDDMTVVGSAEETFAVDFRAGAE